MSKNFQIVSICSVAMLLVAGSAIAARGTSGASNSFIQKNIFDAARLAPVPPIDQPKPVYYFKLTGTMSYGSRSLAFFDGTDRRFRNKVLVPGDKIGGYVVTQVNNDSIALQADGNEVLLRVGMRLAEVTANKSKDMQ